MMQGFLLKKSSSDETEVLHNTYSYLGWDVLCIPPFFCYTEAGLG